mmetsp:Transcript_3303/g.5825  ORF Transcript_3303/g.5825 Transcript_3303/m.5825 type:complete len:174 (-) Transcript_3303:287-808(-)
MAVSSVVGPPFEVSMSRHVVRRIMCATHPLSLPCVVHALSYNRRCTADRNHLAQPGTDLDLAINELRLMLPAASERPIGSTRERLSVATLFIADAFRTRHQPARCGYDSCIRLHPPSSSPAISLCHSQRLRFVDKVRLPLGVSVTSHRSPLGASTAAYTYTSPSHRSLCDSWP